MKGRVSRSVSARPAWRALPGKVTTGPGSGRQVISGGHFDVDCSVQDPLGSTIYRETRKQYDSFTHQAAHTGAYRFCFSNEFSTFSHKTVYFDFRVGDEPPILPEMGSKVTALTQVSGRPVTPPPTPPPACPHPGQRAVPAHLVPVCGLCGLCPPFPVGPEGAVSS